MSCCGDLMDPIDAGACCTPTDTAVRAAQAMRTSGCGCAPVVDDTASLKVVGVVTARRLLRRGRRQPACVGCAGQYDHATGVSVLWRG